MGYTKPETQRQWRERNPERYATYKARAVKKYAEDAAYRAARNAKGSAAARQKYASDPAVREKERARRRAYTASIAPERVAEGYLCEQVSSHGGMCPKFIDPSRRGAPDRMVLLPGRSVYFVEMKRAKLGKLRPWQQRYHDDLRALGHEVRVLWSKEDVDEFFAGI
jgi:hypothetical protein